MATLNELIAQLNASSDRMLSDAGRMNIAADNMNQTMDQTLDNMGVQEISGVEGLLPDERQDKYRQEIYTPEQKEYLPSTTQQVIDSSSYVLPQNLGTNFPKEGIMSQITDAIGNYFQGGGILGNFLLRDMDPRQAALRNYYGYNNIGQVPSGLMQGYNPVSGGGLYTLTGGRFGQEPTYGLQNAYQKRIDTINKTLARKYADGDYSGTQLDERLKQLENAKIQESMMLDRVNENTAFENYRNDRDSYSGGETTTNVGGQNITSYSDPFDLGGGE
jgi:hypothetical protein